MTLDVTLLAPGRVAVLVSARGSTDATDQAKRAAREAGYRIRTVARVSPNGDGTTALQTWRVELAVSA